MEHHWILWISCESWLQNVCSIGRNKVLELHFFCTFNIKTCSCKGHQTPPRWWKPSFAKVKAREDSYAPLPAFSEQVLVGWMTFLGYLSNSALIELLHGICLAHFRSGYCKKPSMWARMGNVSASDISDPECFHFMTFQNSFCLLKSSKHEPLAVARFVL
jgi:hypothetical protein